MSNFAIAVDFDGTCVDHCYPEVGKDVPNAVVVLKRILQQNVKLILFTMRSDKELADAVQWFQDRDIELWGINENPEQKEWTQSPKAYANIYIDDAALGAPLTILPGYRRYFVNWIEVERHLKIKGILPLGQDTKQ